MKALLELFRAHKAGSGFGLCSVCSSHPLVIEAALREAARDDAEYALIEATSNQVNQFGGYTGMTPTDFKAYVAGIAARASLPMERVLLGGDHLGPNCWRTGPAAEALARSEQLVSDYVAAGFRKIHLDCSMSCADDPGVLTEAVIAARAARLCQASERAWRASGGDPPGSAPRSAQGAGGGGERRRASGLCHRHRSAHTGRRGRDTRGAGGHDARCRHGAARSPSPRLSAGR